MAGDPHWDSVVLAMHMDGTNGSTAFADLKGNAVTAVGNVQISTSQSKFGGASAVFDGSGDYLTVPNSAGFNFGTGDFTIEGWVWVANVTGYKCIFGGSTPGEVAFYVNAAGLELGKWGVAGIAGSGGTPVSASTWFHACITRVSGDVRIFCNGVQTGTTTPDTTNISYSGLLCLGADTARASGMNGYVDDLRVTKGVARYTANFTPPTQAFPNGPALISGTTKDATGAFAPRAVRVHRKSDGALSGAVTSQSTTGAFSVPALDGTPHYAIAHDSDADPYWDKVVLATHFDTDSVIDPHISNVVLGLHMEGANGSTTFVDVTGKTVTRFGNTQISTARSKFGNSSAAFDGSGDYLTLPNTTDFDFPVAFTIDGWVYMSSYPSGWAAVVSRYYDPTPAGYRIILNENVNGTWQFSFVGSDDGVRGVAGGGLVTGAWYHLEVGFDGSTYYTFTNGVLNTTLSAPAPKAVGTLMAPIIGSTNTGVWFLTGHVDDLRITKGVCRHMATFTPPTVPFGSFKDLTGKDLMCNGAPTISTATKKYGGGSLAITSANTGISVPFNSGLEFGAGSFTVEYWINAVSPANNIHLSRRVTSSQVVSFITYFDSLGRAAALLSCDGVDWQAILTGITAVSANTWVHIALVRHGSVLTLYLNGVAETRANLGTSSLLAMTTGLGVGTDLDATTSFNGFIADLRITKGVARYVTDFTPPDNAFPGALGAGTRNALIFDDLTPV